MAEQTGSSQAPMPSDAQPAVVTADPQASAASGAVAVTPIACRGFASEGDTELPPLGGGIGPTECRSWSFATTRSYRGGRNEPIRLPLQKTASDPGLPSRSTVA
jgi:hypothetical protein